MLPGKSNYLLGNEPDKWRTGVSTYAKVGYENVYPGVDLIYYGNQRELEYDFVVAPGADPRVITLGFQGADGISIDLNGNLVLATDVGDLISRAPVVYQEIGGTRVPITGHYELRGGVLVGFQVGSYDTSLPLVIDPVIIYSTYLGGSSGDFSGGIAVDSAGSVYVTGRTESTNFPTQNPQQANSNDGGADVFVTKLNPAGTALVYSTYLGGTNFDHGSDIAVNPSGNAYVTGYTHSSNFPTANALQPNFGGVNNDAFVTKLSIDGSSIVFSTFLGGSSNEKGRGVAVDVGGNAYLTGYTDSSNFPTLNPLQANNAGFRDAYVTKLDAAGALVYSTYLGSGGGDGAHAVAVDSSGNAYVTGDASPGFPMQNPSQAAFGGGIRDIFVTKVNPAGTALVYSTFLGGSDRDFGYGIAVDGSGSAYVAGQTYSNDFPTQNPFQGTFGGGFNDAIVTKLNPAGSALVYSTYLGGSNLSDSAGDIAIDSAGNAYITGFTQSPSNFPTLNPLPSSPSDLQNAFVTKLDGSGGGVYSTLLGGGTPDRGNSIAVDSQGNAYVTGDTFSTNFPTTSSSYDTTHNGGGFDAFVTKLGVDTTPPSVSTPDLTPASDTGSLNDDNVTQDNTPAFTITAEAGALVELIDGATVLTSGTASGGTDQMTLLTQPDGVYNIFARATDAAGNFATTGSLLVAIDNVAPTITLLGANPVAVNLGDTYSDAGATAFDLLDGNITAGIVTVNPVINNIPGDYVVSYNVEDREGNPAVQVTRSVSVADGVPPVLSNMPSDVIISTDLGVSTAVVTYSIPTATDNVGVTSITCVPASGSIFILDATPVTCTALDGANNSDQASFTVTVVDNENPDVNVPSNTTVGTDLGVLTAVVEFTPTATDNVAVTSITCDPAAGSAFPVGATTVTCTATDTTGNTGQASFIVTVDPPPTWNVPDDITVNTDLGLPTAVVIYTATASDNVDVSSSSCTPASGDIFVLGTTTVNCTASDAFGSVGTASFTVTVVDNEDPILTVPEDVTVEASGPSGQAVTIGSATVTDNADASPVIDNDAPELILLGATTVNWTATDAAGNAATDTQDVTVEDTVPPSIIAPAGVTATATGALTVVALGTPTISDVADLSPVVTNDAPDSFPVGLTTVTWTATDASQNQATATQAVTIEGPTTDKLAVIDLLTPFAEESKRVEKAIRELNKGLEDKLWLNGFPDPRQGKKVFDRERHAVKELIHLVKDVPKGKGKGKKGNNDEEPTPIEIAAADAIDALTTIDQFMAQVAIDNAKNADVVDPNRQDKVDKEIDRAEKELEKGDSEAGKDKSKSDKAIDHYTKAWKHAQQAMAHAAKLPEPEKVEKEDKSDPLDLEDLTPLQATAVMILEISEPGFDPALGAKLIEVQAALTSGQDASAVGLLEEFIDLVKEQRGELLTNEQARVLKRSAKLIIRAVENG